MTGSNEGQPTTDVVTAQPPAPDGEGRALADVSASLRRHRIWLVILSVGLVLSVCGTTAVFFSSVGPMFFWDGGMDAVEDSDITAAQTRVEDAYGDRLEDVTVREVTVSYGAAPFPYSLMGVDETSYIYVEYRLTGSEVTFADLVDMFGADISSTGILPTEGTLQSRMTQEELDRLLEAYAAETDSPLGAVRRYGDDPYMMDMGTTVPEEIEVGGDAYPTKLLWKAVEGYVTESDEIDMADGMDMSRRALVFYQDPDTGEFTFLGTEASEVLW